MTIDHSFFYNRRLFGDPLVIFAFNPSPLIEEDHALEILGTEYLLNK